MKQAWLYILYNSVSRRYGKKFIQYVRGFPCRQPEVGEFLEKLPPGFLARKLLKYLEPK
jgi:hypothetical protein